MHLHYKTIYNMNLISINRIVILLLLVGIILYGRLSFIDFSIAEATENLENNGNVTDNVTENLTIQDLIDAAEPGATIYITNGTYHENIVINKSISLIGENRESTIINGLGGDHAISIIANMVKISNFTIKGSTGRSNGGIGLNDVYRCNISNCNLSYNNDGIYLLNSSYNFITNNIFSNNRANGIQLYTSSYNEITDNTILHNKRNGIELYHFSNENIIEQNSIFNNDHRGIDAYSSSQNFISNNYISNFIGGIQLYNSANNNLMKNSFTNNGISISGVSPYYYFQNISSDNVNNGKPIYYHLRACPSNRFSQPFSA